MSYIKEIKNLPHFQLVTTDSALEEVCQQAESKSAVALDTEFVRIRSFYPKLGLIQLYDGESVSLIDPTVIQDFSPFIQLLANVNVIKVLHASNEDLEVLHHTFQQLPTPLMDTQIMATFLDFPQSTGFATLVKAYFSLELDKGASRTDWLARPLSEVQLNYAAADVWYLLPLYEKMQQQITERQWQSAVQNDCGLLLKKQRGEKDAEKAYFYIPNAWKLDQLELARLQLLAKWRYEEAMKRDLALNFVVQGEHLWLAAKHNPKHTSELLNLGFSSQEVRIHGKKILHILSQVKRLNEQDYPPLIKKLSEDPRYKTSLKHLQAELKKIAPDNLASEVIASKKMLENLLKWVWFDKQSPEKIPVVLQDWRKPYGEKLLLMVNSM